MAVIEFRLNFIDYFATPTVTMAYDRVGNLTEATTAGVVTNLYAYDLCGHCTNEWQNSFRLERFHDALGRSTGYAVNGTRQTTISYDTYGRIASMSVPTPEGENVLSSTSPSTFTSFTWSYLTNSDLKASLDTRTQLIFTTHDLLLLDQDLCRRDEMWVTDKAPDGSATLSDFSAFKGLRKGTKIRDVYLDGRLGGIPRHI